MTSSHMRTSSGLISHIEDEDGQEDKEMDMKDESMSDDVESDANPWEKLIEEVMNDMNSHWEEQVTIHLYQGASKEHAEAESFNDLLLAFRKRLRYVCETRWKQHASLWKRKTCTLKSQLKQLLIKESIC